MLVDWVGGFPGSRVDVVKVCVRTVQVHQRQAGSKGHGRHEGQ